LKNDKYSEETKHKEYGIAAIGYQSPLPGDFHKFQELSHLIRFVSNTRSRDFTKTNLVSGI
jgi:hypothetical protein